MYIRNDLASDELKYTICNLKHCLLGCNCYIGPTHTSGRVCAAFLSTDAPIVILVILAPCQWGSHPDSHVYKLIVIL